MDLSLKDQVAIITGASSGIGEGVARAMAQEGAVVVINYPFESEKENAQKILNDITGTGGKGIIKMADVSKEDLVLNMFTEVIQQLGTVDILVNNAGIQKDSSFAEMTAEKWNAVLSVSLTGHFFCAREAVKEFLRRGIEAERSCAAGKIICMSSVHQLIPWADHANYATSKGGIMMLMESMTQELATKKIRINSIAPGTIKTNINHEAWNTPEAEKKLLKLIPYGRVGEVSDIGKAAVWFASGHSDYVTGTTLFVDGGMTLFPGLQQMGRSKMK